jgi:pilus assembly protein CpaB
MRFAITLLIAIGLVSALAAAVLVHTLTQPAPDKPTTRTEPAEVTIVVAKQKLPAMSVLSAEAVQTRTVPRSQAPKGAASDAVEAVGRVLKMPVVAGEALTRQHFVQKGSASQLAAALPKGKRAMTVSLSDYSGMAGLVYPGSIVDVLATVKPPETNAHDASVSTTLLQHLQVLAVGDRTIVSDDQGSNLVEKDRRSTQRLITLLVAPDQAERLQLAVKHGSISLAMRNPLDSQQRLNELTYFGQLLGQKPTAFLDEHKEPKDDDQPKRQVTPSHAAASDQPWEVTVIRGDQRTTHEFQGVDQAQSSRQPLDSGTETSQTANIKQ